MQMVQYRLALCHHRVHDTQEKNQTAFADPAAVLLREIKIVLCMFRELGSL